MTDAVQLAQRLSALLETGRRVATYKLATLLALLDAAAEADPVPGATDELVVAIPELADRVIDLYWPQVRAFGAHGVLRQSTQERAVIVEQVTALQALGRSAAAVRLLQPAVYAQGRRRVALTLAQQPLPALQTPTGSSTGTAFLYDDRWLRVGATTTRDLDVHDWSIVLLPGVADGLVRLGGLLRPVIQGLWLQDVARHNKIAQEQELLSRHLFGAERTDLTRVRSALDELQQGACFYCGSAVGAQAQVDPCPGPASLSTGWPTWSWPTVAATAPRATLSRPSTT